MYLRNEFRNKTIHAATPEEFDAKLNAALTGIQNPRVEYDRTQPFTCYVLFEASQVEPEPIETISVPDIMERIGCGAKCGDCPNLKRTGDKRRKWFGCDYAKYGTTRVDSAACEQYYIERLKNGKKAESRDTSPATQDWGHRPRIYQARRSGRRAFTEKISRNGNGRNESSSVRI